MKLKIHSSSFNVSYQDFGKSFKLRAQTLSKKTFLFLTLVVACATSSAQIERGRMMLGGSFNTQNNNSTTNNRDSTNAVLSRNTNKSSALNVSLRYGYFISDGWMIGVMAGYNKNYDEAKTEYLPPYLPTQYSAKQTSPYFSGGVFTRYYKMIGKSRFAWFGELSASYGAGKNKYTTENNGTVITSSGKAVYANASIRPGLTYFFTNVLAVEASFGNLGYNYSKTESESAVPGSSKMSSTSSGFNSHLNFSLSSINLGFNFYFGGKKS